MNRYHIEVISNSVRTRRAVDADGISWSESGLYEFWKRNDNGKTIIDNIEFNIEEKNEQ